MVRTLHVQVKEKTMLVEFKEIIEAVLHHEGGYVNDPKDPGGETKYGVSRKVILI